MMPSGWPDDWEELTRGQGCGMCDSTRPDEDHYGIRIHATKNADAMLQRVNIQRGYTLVIWRGRHVTEPFELSDDEAAGYWREVAKVAKALAGYYKPLKMNYETLGNSLPHLHTHLLPRFVEDPAPGRPFPLLPQDGAEKAVPEGLLRRDAKALRELLA